ncbi:MAG: CapA family protein [Deltaproteobacteria bacterium]|jgi:poly-gamma-glutamate capsule biosynthesis protein CapA/YwtB (metallophosphatase superfamily)|nr:CapA family protein [Deltaproteobacteria bacterium]
MKRILGLNSVFLLLAAGLAILGAACAQAGPALQAAAGEPLFSPSEPPKDPPPNITVSACGDLMLGTENLLPPDGSRGMLAAAKPYLKGRDIVFGNLEGPLTDRGASTKDTSTGRSFSFRSPPAFGSLFQEAGFNILSLANNHVNDYGPAGREQTVQILDSLGIKHTGAPDQLTVLDLSGGRKAVFLGLAPNRGCQDINDIEAAAALVRQAEADYPGALVIVSFHGGAEGTAAMNMPLGPEMYLGEKRGDLRRLALALIDSGADLLIGHGPHVPRGLEVYKDRLIIYSLGNFATASGINIKGATGLAPLVQAELTDDGRLVSYRIISFRQEPNRGPQLDSSEEARLVMERLSADLARRLGRK